MKNSTYDNLKNFVIVTLVLLNIGCIWLLFKQPSSHDKFKNNRSKYSKNFLKTEVGFDAEQMNQVKSLRSSHKEEIKSIKKQIRLLRNNMIDNLDNDTFNIATHTEKIASLQKQLDIMAFKHFKELKQICRQDQNEKFDLVMKKMFSRESKSRYNQKPKTP